MSNIAVKETHRKVTEEKIRRLQMQSWQLDPMLWLKERFGEDNLDYEWSLRPEYSSHKWDGSKDPLATVWRAIARGEDAGIESCTSSGKTFMLSRVVFWFLDTHHDSLVVTSAPKQDQLTLQLWAEITKAFDKFKRIRPKAALYNLRLVVEEETDADKHRSYENDEEIKKRLDKSWHAVGFVAGVGTDEQSATKAQGFHRKDMLIITEETPGMPNAVMVAFQQTSTAGNNPILAVGNPDSELDPLHEFCITPDITHVRISAYDHPNIVNKSEIIPGAVTQKSIDRRKLKLGEKSSLFKSRIRGISPSQSVDSLIQMEWLEKALIHREPGDDTEPHKLYDGSYHAVGIDASNSIEGDKAALAWYTGNILKSVQEFFCTNATHLAYNLIFDDYQLEENGWTNYHTEKLKDYDIMDGMMGVDSVGIGIATLNAFLDHNFHPVPIQGGQWEEAIPMEDYFDDKGKDKTRPMYKFQGLRSQVWYEFREDLRQGLIKIDIQDKELLKQIKRELLLIKYEDKGNFIAVEPKDNLKKRIGGKSPNVGDAIVYGNWVRKGYRMTSGGMPVFGG